MVNSKNYELISVLFACTLIQNCFLTPSIFVCHRKNAPLASWKMRIGKGSTSEAQGVQGFFPPMDASADSPPAASSSKSRDPPSGSAVHQLQAQLRQQQNQHERAQMALQAQLNQVTRERKKHEMADLRDRPSTPVSQSKGPQQFLSQSEATQPQPASASSSSRPLLDTSQCDALHSTQPDTNPFLPPHAVQSIIGLETPARPFTPNGSELGKASLLQMNELSRRAAYLNANGGDGNLWSGMNFTADASQQQERRQPAQKTQGSKPTRASEQPRDGNREMVQTGWENSNAPQSMSGFATSEERERVDFNVLMARDDSSNAMPVGVPETVEGRRGRQRGRESDSNFLAKDEMACGVEPADGYGVASQEQSQQTLLAPSVAS
jgi:hypothetical protein